MQRVKGGSKSAYPTKAQARRLEIKSARHGLSVITKRACLAAPALQKSAIADRFKRHAVTSDSLGECISFIEMSRGGDRRDRIAIWPEPRLCIEIHKTRLTPSPACLGMKRECVLDQLGRVEMLERLRAGAHRFAQAVISLNPSPDRSIKGV